MAEKTERISETLDDILTWLHANRDNEVQMCAEILPQYIQDHNDKQAYRDVDKQVKALGKAWDKMITLITKARQQVAAIENQPDINFYGD